MLRLPNLEAIEALLLDVPALVDRLEAHDPAFLSTLKTWFSRTEEALRNNRLPAAADVAACRGVLIAVERGENDDASPRASKSGRRYREARAGHLLRRATEAVAEAVRARRAQVDEAERLMMQLVAAADRLGLVPAAASGQTHTAYLQSIRQAISARSELASAFVHVTGILGETDSLIVVDRSIAALRQ
jgi:hypothetical protein